MITAVQNSLVILGCSQRKRQTSRLLPAVDRYDGPLFRVLRRRIREKPEGAPQTHILSARFGLIPGNALIPRYNRSFPRYDHSALRELVERQVERVLHDIRPERVFASVGLRYWPLIEKPLARAVPPHGLVIGKGGIGGRASQLAHWLRPEGHVPEVTRPRHPKGEATLLSATIRLSRAEIIERARAALATTPREARRFETWYVPVDEERVAAKWLVGLLFRRPVHKFRTADARRVLSLLGVDCLDACNH